MNAIANASKTKRAGFTHPVPMPSCLSSVIVVADSPRNTPLPAAGIKP